MITSARPNATAKSRVQLRSSRRNWGMRELSFGVAGPGLDVSNILRLIIYSMPRPRTPNYDRALISPTIRARLQPCHIVIENEGVLTPEASFAEIRILPKLRSAQCVEFCAKDRPKKYGTLSETRTHSRV